MEGLKQSYEEWKQCLFVDNKQPFTKEFVQSRLDVLTDSKQQETKTFIHAYGETYTRQIVSYFKRALKEVK